MAFAKAHPLVRTNTGPSDTVNASLLSICQAMASKLELDEVLNTIITLTVRVMKAQQGSILLFDEHRDCLQMLATFGLPREIVEKGYIPRKGSIAEYVIENRQPLILNDRVQGERFKGIEDQRRIVSALCVPLMVSGHVLGTINLNRTEPLPGPFRDEDLDTMAILASQAAIAIENSRLHEANLRSERLAAIGQTVAGISHCIKNVLTGVRGGVSLIDMARQSEDWNLTAQGSDILRRNLDRLSSIVLDMLDFSKERKPNKQAVNLPTLIEDLVTSTSSEGRLKGITIENRTDPQVLTLQADAQQIYRCLLNLVQNAMDATPKKGMVWIGTERTTSRPALDRLGDKTARGAIILRVGDTGPGIDEQTRRNIFDPFFSTKGSKGTGLGLAVTRKIISEHGGSIEVESPPDHPTVFAIYLPD